MSCDCNTPFGENSSYGSVCRPDIPYPSVSHESVPSLIDNLVTALYGSFTPTAQNPNPYNTKSIVNGKVVWNIACDPNNTANVAGISRNAGEGLLCYILRVLNQTGIVGAVTLNGVQTLTNKTLVSPVMNGEINFGDATIVGGNFNGLTAAFANDIAGGSSGQLLYQSASGVTSKLETGDAGYILQSQGTSAPQWVAPSSSTTAGNIGGGLAGSIPYQTAVDTTTMLAAGTNGQILQTNGTAPSWTSSFTGNSATATTATNLSGGSINGTSGTLSGGLSVTGNVTANKFNGQVIGNVTGNLLGNVTGNVTGSSGSCTGNATSATTASEATKLQSAKTIQLTGIISSSAIPFDGSSDITIPTSGGDNPIQLCKAWVNFNGTTGGTWAGGASTVTRVAASTTAKVTTTNDHGLTTGNTVYALTGVVAGSYTVTVLTITTFTITTVATTALTAVAITFQGSIIRSSYNVSSITKNGTGYYTINFTNPMADANYSLGGIVGQAASQVGQSIMLKADVAPTTTGVQIKVQQGNLTTNTDAPYVCVQVFGN
jgi:hypothetical protein